MSKTVNIHEAKTHFSKLAKEVEGGAEIIIARGGEPIMKLVPLGPKKMNRELGFAAKHLTDFSWEEWEASHEEFLKLFKDYEDFK